MKKVFALTALTLVLVMAFAAPAFAVKPAAATKAQNIPWYWAGGSSDNALSNLASGHVMVNTPSGAVSMIVNGAVDLTESTTYEVWVQGFGGTGAYLGGFDYYHSPNDYFAIGSFTTDEFGHGEFHFNIPSGQLSSGTRNIQIAINTTPVIGSTVICTRHFDVVN